MSSSCSYSNSNNNPQKVVAEHDVFLSFRGEDTRSGFTSHLYDALVREGIKTFFDDDNLVRGKAISEGLMRAIQSSRISVVVLSENYAFSSWCLTELCKIVECMDTCGLLVLPIFYHVNPSQARKLFGSYRDAFKKHENNPRLDFEEVETWRDALKRVGNLAGWTIEETDVEAKFIKDFIAKISSLLDIRNESAHEPATQSRLQDVVYFDHNSVSKKVKPSNAPLVVGKLLDYDYPEDVIKQWQRDHIEAHIIANDTSKEKNVIFTKRNKKKNVSNPTSGKGKSLLLPQKKKGISLLSDPQSSKMLDPSDDEVDWSKLFESSCDQGRWLEIFKPSGDQGRWLEIFKPSGDQDLWSEIFKPSGDQDLWSETFKLSADQDRWSKFFKPSGDQDLWSEIFKPSGDQDLWSEIFKPSDDQDRWSEIFKPCDDQDRWSEIFKPCDDQDRWSKIFKPSDDQDRWSKIFHSSDDEYHFGGLGNGSKALEILKAHFQDCSGPTKGLRVVVFESKISSWFTKLSSEQSISTQLKRNWWKSNLMGLAICVCFRPYPSNTLSCKVRLKNSAIQIGEHRCHPKCGKSKSFDRIWMIYLSRDDVPKQLLKNVSGGNIEISFHNELVDDRLCFQQCGIRLVYKKDIVELNQIN